MITQRSELKGGSICLSILLLCLLSNISFAQTKIMPLGDSITNGIKSSDSTGYRNDLEQMLIDEGINFDFVGSLRVPSNGSGFNDPNNADHEGHDGFRADDILGQLTTYLNANPPDIVLLHIGTNDITESQTPESTRDEIDDIVTAIRNFDSNISIILSSLIPRTDAKSANNITLNSLLSTLFNTKRSQGYKIFYAGNYEVFTCNPNWAAEWMTDAKHPNDTGYNVMAGVFFNAIMNALTNTDITVTDNFERSALGIVWTADPEFTVQNGDLVNTATADLWEYVAIYKGITNPNVISMRWSNNADAAGVEESGLVLMLDACDPDNSNGYAVTIRTSLNQLRLWTIANGTISQSIHSPSYGLPDPLPGDVLKVQITSDGTGHHFEVFINDQSYGTLTDPNKLQGNGDVLLSGVILKGNRNNDVAEFSLQASDDIVPPAAVTDLSIVDVTSTSVNLTWTASGDDENTGTAASYDLRYSTSDITDADFSSATQVAGLPNPSPPGTAEFFEVSGLSPAFTYYFALKVGDEVGNLSSISNVPSATTSAANLFTDTFERTDLGSNWTADPVYQIVNNELANTSTDGNNWNMAVLNARKNPKQVSFQWGAEADASGIDKGGLVLMLDSATITASGYLVTRRTTVNELRLWTITNGVIDTPPIQILTPNLPAPVAGQEFKVELSSDETGHYFDVFVNGQFDIRLTDPNKLQGNAVDLYAGVMLVGNENNNIDDFTIISPIQPPSELIIVDGNNQIGSVGQLLPIPLRVRLIDNSGNPVPGRCIIFTVTSGGGSVDAPPPSENIVFEAESGIITSPMTIAADVNASSSQYIHLPDGSGSGVGQAEYTIDIAQAGDYVIWGRVINPDNRSDSFFIQMDGGPELTWDVGQIQHSSVWVWDAVSDRGAGNEPNPETDPVIFTLSAGVHTLLVKGRDDGTKLDQIVLTRDLNFVPTGIQNPGGVITDGNGEATTNWTLGITPGTNTVEASFLGLPPVQFTAEATPLIPDNITKAADSGDNQTGTAGKPLAQPFRVLVTDNSAIPVPGADVTFAVIGGGGNFGGSSQTTVVTNAQGIAEATLTLGPSPATTNTAQALASHEGTPLNGSPVTFTATSAAPQDLQAVSQLIQNGTVNLPLADSIKVRVRDALSQPLGDFPVTFTVTMGGGKVNGSSNPVQVLTDANGIAKVEWRLGSTAGQSNNKLQASAIFNSQPLNGSPIEFTASAEEGAAANLVKVSGDSLSGLVQTPLSEPFVVKITDASDNSVSGWPVTFTVEEGGGNIDGNTSKIVTTNANGNASATLTLGSTAGTPSNPYNNRVKATAENNGPLNGSPVIFVASATATDACCLDIVAGANQTGPASLPLPEQIQAKVTDSQSNPISGHPVTFSVKTGGGTINGTAAGDTVKTISTNENGIAAVTWYLGGVLGANSQSLQVSANDGINELNGSPSTLFASATIGPVDPDASFLSSDASEVPANGQSVATITITLTDKFGNPIEGKAVNINSTGEFNIINQPTGPTDASGQTQATIASTKAEVKTIGATVLPEFLDLNNSIDVVFTPLDPEIMEESGGNGQTANVGTAVENPIEVIVKDNNDNPVSGVAVEYVVTSGGGFFVNGESAPLGALSKVTIVATTDGAGKASAIWVLGSDPGINKAEARVEGLAGSPVRFTATGVNAVATNIDLHSGDNQNGLIAGTILPEPLKVIVTDASGKAVANVPVEFSVQLGGGTLSNENPSTDYMGIAQSIYTLGTIVGTNIVEASNPSLSGTPVTFTFESIVGTPSILSFEGESGSGAVNTLFTATVKVTDINTNPVGGVHADFQVIEGGATIQSEENSTNQSGRAQVHVLLPTAIGTVKVKATSNDLPGFFDIFTISVLPGNATSITEFSGNNQEGTIGRELVYPLEVLINDTYGNPAPGHEVQWVRTLGAGQLRFTSSTSDEDGIARNYFTLGNQAGTNEAWAIASTLSGSPIIFTAMGVTNNFPEFVGLNDTSVVEGNRLQFQVNAIDNDNDPITYEAQNLPSGASFNTDTFSWTPGDQQSGNYEVTFIARDGRGGLDSETMTITVVNSNHPPVINSFTPAELQLARRMGTTINFSVNVTDADGDTPTYKWTYVFQGNETLISTSSQFTFNTADFSLGTYIMRVEVTDGKDTVSLEWTLDIITSIELATFTAHFAGFDGVQILWTTSREIDNLGFNVLRSRSRNGDFIQINDNLIPSDDEGEYKFFDTNVDVASRYFYILEDVDVRGFKTRHGPISVDVTAPKTYELSQNYPNPFNPETKIRFQLPEAGHVIIKIFDLLGREVKTLVNEQKQAGFHVVTWDAKDNINRNVSSGIYYYQINAGDFHNTKKMLLLR